MRFFPLRFPPFVAVACLLLITSCGDDPTPQTNNPSNPPPGPTSCQLKAFSTALFTCTYTRNSDSKVTRVSYVSGEYKGGSSIQYDGNGRVSRIDDDKFQTTYAYDENGRVIKVTFVNEAPTSFELAEEVRTYTYNAAGRLDKELYGSSAYNRYEYDEKGNVSKLYIYWGSGIERLYLEYVGYDDKPSMFTNTPFTQSITSDMSGVKSIRTAQDLLDRKHNPLTWKQYGPDGSFTSNSASYTYNDLGYPTQIQGPQQETVTMECK